ncbi:MAG TPA: hypothetical protein VFD32_24370 [Dehalococcoidia bacterium]|nr:hypothetical protein [Dehalococcoidia bacterium]
MRWRSPVRLLALATLFAVGLAGGPLQHVAHVAAQGAGFSCGPYTKTYVVTNLSTQSFGGNRCVKYPDGGDPLSFAWYGEGNWNGRTYRHVGKAQSNGDGYTATASAADLYGEDDRNSFMGTIAIRVTSWAIGFPGEIDVTGAWWEHWSYVPSTFYVPLPKPNICGDNFDQYLVAPPTRPAEVDGIRCVLPLGAGRDTVWYGIGNWGGVTYTHIGIMYAGERYGEAADLCAPALGGFCNQVGAYGISFTRSGPHSFVVGGTWNELWQ